MSLLNLNEALEQANRVLQGKVITEASPDPKWTVFAKRAEDHWYKAKQNAELLFKRDKTLKPKKWDNLTDKVDDAIVEMLLAFEESTDESANLVESKNYSKYHNDNYALYDDEENDPKSAVKDIDQAISDAVKNIKKMIKKNRKLGADDTMSREEIVKAAQEAMLDIL